MKKIIFFLTLIFLTFFFLLFTTYSCVFAENIPLSVPNNKVGIHIFDEKDLPDAARLVNTNGDWGYVTFVITEGERDHDRWQTAFDQMRRLHLIPIVRLATKADGNIWEKPNETEINNWIAFLNSLNWVTENRYVIISNEPNHADEWGGTLDPGGYAAYLREFSQKLHDASPDFFVLPAALDASANNSSSTMEESRFIRNMLRAVPDIYDSVDGWNSHSYPNTGHATIYTFDWELSYIQSLGVTKDLPVFITETGWTTDKFSDEQISSNLINAYQGVWNDPRIVAVTPFILNYPNPPFQQFSWKKNDGTFYNFYTAIENMPKTVGDPVQIIKGDIVAAFAQPVIPIGSDYIGAILARNTGQSIWSQNSILIGSDFVDLPVKSISFQDIEPTKLGLLIFKAASPGSTGIYTRSLFLKDTKGERVTNSFPIEAYVVKVDQNQINYFLTSAENYIRGFLKI